MAETKQEVKHTALPWRIPVANVFRIVSPRAPGGWDVVADMDTDRRGGPEAHANAELIVRAVNNFEGMLAALEAISKLDPEFDSEDGWNEWGEAECFGKAKKLAEEAIRAARQGR